MADAADKGKLYSICYTPKIERNFCDGLEMRFTVHHH